MALAAKIDRWSEWVSKVFDTSIDKPSRIVICMTFWILACLFVIRGYQNQVLSDVGLSWQTYLVIIAPVLVTVLAAVLSGAYLLRGAKQGQTDWLRGVARWIWIGLLAFFIVVQFAFLGLMNERSAEPGAAGDSAALGAMGFLPSGLSETGQAQSAGGADGAAIAENTGPARIESARSDGVLGSVADFLHPIVVFFLLGFVPFLFMSIFSLLSVMQQVKLNLGETAEDAAEAGGGRFGVLAALGYVVDVLAALLRFVLNFVILFVTTLVAANATANDDDVNESPLLGLGVMVLLSVAFFFFLSFHYFAFTQHTFTPTWRAAVILENDAFAVLRFLAENMAHAVLGDGLELYNIKFGELIRYQGNNFLTGAIMLFRVLFAAAFLVFLLGNLRSATRPKA